jgi:hypothetical protein
MKIKCITEKRPSPLRISREGKIGNKGVAHFCNMVLGPAVNPESKKILAHAATDTGQ